MTHRFQPGQTSECGTPGEPDDLRAVFVYGRLRALPRPRLAAILVNQTGRLVRTPAAASAVVLAHAAAAGCLGPDQGLALPFPLRAGTRLLSEDAFRRRIDPADRERPPPPGPYALADVARLAALDPSVVRALVLFDVIAPAGAPLAYADLASARQVAQLLAQGVRLPALIRAAATLARRGLRVAQTRLVETPWGEIVQQVGERIAQLDGQFALVLDEEIRSADDSFVLARSCEADGDLVAAERWYRRAAQLDPADPVALFNLGNLLAVQARTAEAMAAFARALDRDRAFAEARFNLARLREERGETQAALAGYAATIAAHPHYAQAIYNHARLLTRLESYATAGPLWDRFITLAPNDPDIGHARRLSLLCRMQGRY